MFNTAELYKSYHLNISLHHLILTPMIMLAIYCITYLSSNAHLASLSFVSLIFYTLFVVFYGALCASSSFSQEIRQKTWDNIRLSSLSVWELAIGKLFGMTIFAWYAGLIALSVLTACLLLHGALLQHLPELLLMVITGLLVHVVAMSLDIQTAEMTNISRASSIAVFLLIIAIIYFSSLLLMSAASSSIMFAFDPSGYLGLGELNWYGTNWDALHFSLVSAMIFLAWALLGLYRQLRELIHCEALLPWAWTIFILYLIFYANGFMFDTWLYHEIPPAKFSNALIISLISTYAIILYKPINIMHYRLLWKHFQAGMWRNFIENIPLWSISYLLCILCSLFIMLTFSDNSYLSTTSLNAFVIGVLLFMLRDILLILYFSFSAQSGKSLFLSAVYLLILYVLLPTLFEAMSISSAAWLFFPPVGAESYTKLLPAFAQVVLMLGLLFLRLRRRGISN